MSRTRPQPGKTKKALKEDFAVNGAHVTHDVLTLAETAVYLRVSTEDVMGMLTTEGLPGRKAGGEWRFLKSAIQNWLSTPVASRGLLSLLGAANDDPYLEVMLADVYARRGRPETEAD
jgi:excisionase family DNA binding protein